MSSEKTARLICSLITVVNTILMILLTALAYGHLEFRDRYYVWLMSIPVIFNLSTAILFAGRCLSPVAPFCCIEEESSQSQDLDDNGDPFEVLAVPGASGYQACLQSSNSSTLCGSSSSKSFFASGSTEIPKTSTMRQTLLSERPGVYKVKANTDGSSFLSDVISSKSTDRKRRRSRTKGGVKYSLLNDSTLLAVPVDLSSFYTSCSTSKSQTISENTPLLAKKSQGPISVFEDPTIYGTVDPIIEKRYPFPMYGVVPRIPGANVETVEGGPLPRSKSMGDSELPSTSGKDSGVKMATSPDYEAPVFYFTPQKQTPKCPETKVEKSEEESPKVDLELPSTIPSHRVADWIIKSPSRQKKSPKTKESPTKSFHKSPHKSKAAKGKSTTPSKAQAQSMKPVLAAEGEDRSSSSTKELNKFCLLGRGYFYATETADYMPVETPNYKDDQLTESTDSEATLKNSPKGVSKTENAK